MENPCQAEIRNIWIQSGNLVDAIQVQYQLPSGTIITSARRGGAGGHQSHIPVHFGEKIIGVFGSTRSSADAYVSQLYFLKLTANNRVQIYGPYGTSKSSVSYIVLGDIKSFFGRNNFYLNALGMYYEPWGQCD